MPILPHPCGPKISTASHRDGRSCEPTSCRTSWRSSWPTISGPPSWLLFWLGAGPTSSPTSWILSWLPSCSISSPISWPRSSWPPSFVAGPAGYGPPARCNRRMTMPRRKGSKKECSPSAADPSILSPTSPSPYNEARPSSLPPNACAAPPAAGLEARPRPPVNQTYKLHFIDTCARRDPPASLSSRATRCRSSC